jgi:hypothetical protein
VSRKRLDLTGQQFGRLTVVAFIGVRFRGKKRDRYWLCRCECGNTTEIRTEYLHAGTRSCGCLQRESFRAIVTSHGHAVPGKTSPEYHTWAGMLDRCRNANNKKWALYGGRGITVCDRWRQFEDFLADMGTRPTAHHSIDRIDNDGHYEPGNCRWATQKEQMRNVSYNRVLTFGAKTQPVAAWGEELGIKSSLISGRLARGWSVERALTEPVNAQFGPKKYKP